MKGMLIRSLPVKLTSAELVIKGQELAEAEISLSELKEEKKEVMAGLAQRLLAKRNLVGEIAHIINTKQEYRGVECEEVRHEKELKVSVIRKDTGKVVSERLMSPKERQQILSFPKPSAAKKASGKQGSEPKK